MPVDIRVGERYITLPMADGRGQRVPAVHETLDVPRLVSPIVQAMLPFRMPRRA